jgi:predicted transglutaminase-like cysteine proteinase
MSKCFLLRSGSHTLIAILSATVLVGAAAGARAQPRNHATNVASADLTGTAPAPAVFFTINEVLAHRAGRVETSGDGSGRDVASTTRETDPSSQSLPSSPLPSGPFGLAEFRAPAGALWSKWHGVQIDIAHDLTVMAQCRSAPDHCASRAAERFNALIDKARRHNGRERLASVNAAVNNAIRYMSDLEQYGVVDLWSSPLATFTTGRGDCEDYAIAKYVALREAGVAAEDVRLLLVHDQTAREDHAVVAARQDGHWLILDNRFLLLPQDREMWNFVPVYAMDQNGVSLLARPYQRNLVADADQHVLASNKTILTSNRIIAALHKNNNQSGATAGVLLEAGNIADAKLLGA